MKENKTMTFEEKLARLTKIVQELEGGKLSLDQSLVLFEEGNKLSLELHTALNDAKLKIEKMQGK